MEVTVPQVNPGVYYLALDAGEAGVGRAAFEVTAPPGWRSSAAPGTGVSARCPAPPGP